MMRRLFAFSNRELFDAELEDDIDSLTDAHGYAGSVWLDDRQQKVAVHTERRRRGYEPTRSGGSSLTAMMNRVRDHGQRPD